MPLIINPYRIIRRIENELTKMINEDDKGRKRVDYDLLNTIQKYAGKIFSTCVEGMFEYQSIKVHTKKLNRKSKGGKK